MSCFFRSLELHFKFFRSLKRFLDTIKASRRVPKRFLKTHVIIHIYIYNIYDIHNIYVIYIYR